MISNRTQNRGALVRGAKHTATVLACGKDPRYGDIILVFVDDDFRRPSDLEELLSKVSFTAKGFLGPMLKHEAIEAVKPALSFKLSIACPICRVSIPDFERGIVLSDRFNISDGAELREWIGSTEIVRRLPADGGVNAPRLIEMVEQNHQDLSSEMYRAHDHKQWFCDMTGRAWKDCRLL